jgi:hypothetical protein
MTDTLDRFEPAVCFNAPYEAILNLDVTMAVSLAAKSKSFIRMVGISKNQIGEA